MQCVAAIRFVRHCHIWVISFFIHLFQGSFPRWYWVKHMIWTRVNRSVPNYHKVPFTLKSVYYSSDVFHCMEIFSISAGCYKTGYSSADHLKGKLREISCIHNFWRSCPIVLRLCIEIGATTAVFCAKCQYSWTTDIYVLWTKEISRDLSLRWVSEGYLILQYPIFHHDDVIKWKHFPRYWPFLRGIHRSPVNSPQKGQWRGALIFFWSREAGD